MATFKDRIYELRKQRGLTQSDLAEYIGVNKQTISQYERGVRRPDFETLELLCDFFNVSADYMLGKVDITPRYVDSDGLARLDVEPDASYYIDKDAREIAEFLYKNPEYRVLFDASRNVKAKDIEFVRQMIDRLGGNDNDDTGA